MNKLPRIEKLVNLINYQDGAVVSRELISKKSGSVTLFAFDNNQGLSDHTAPFDVLVYIIDGRVEVIIDKTSYQLNIGEMIIIPANSIHAVKSIERFKMLLIMIRS